jgi:hypothetical protein
VSKINEIIDVRGIKAETLVAQFGMQHELFVQMKGVFARNYEDDLLSFENERDRTTATLARDSIFHLLPQGLFCDENFLSGGNKSTFEFEKLHRELKRKTKDALSFFQPFDTTFFKLTLEFEHILNNLAIAGNSTLIKAFLDNPVEDTENIYLSKLFKLLPFASQIRGNIPFFVDILKITISADHIEIRYIKPLHKRFIIHKHGLSKEEFHSLEADMIQLFDFLRNWFLPVEQRFDYRIKDYTQPFKIEDSSILDYNTHL